MKLIGVVVAIALALYAAYLIRTIFLYLILSAIISLLGRPLMDLLGKVKIGRFRIPNSLIAIMVLLFFMLFVAGVFSLFVPLIIDQARIISNIDTNEVVSAFSEPMNRVQQFLSDYDLTEERFDENFFKRQVREILQFGRISSIFQNIFDILGNVFIAIFSLLFMSFFFLRDGNLLRRMIEGVTPDSEAPHVRSILANTKRLLTRYCFGLLIQVTLVTIIVSSSLYFFLGIDNALIIGFMAGLLNLVPYLGPIMGATLAIIIIMLTNLDMSFYDELLPLSGWVLFIFAIMQIIDNMFTQPIIFSNVVNAHPLEIFIIISIAGTLYGITGMIIAIPVYTVMRIIAKEFFSQYKLVDKLTHDL